MTDHLEKHRLRPCPAFGCKTRLEGPAVFCQAHWQQLPAAVRGRIEAAVHDPTGDNMQWAIAEAIADLQGTEQVRGKK